MLAFAASCDRDSERLAHGFAPTQWLPARVHPGRALAVLLMFHPVFDVDDIGPVGLLCFAAAAAVLARSQRTAALAADAGQGAA
jgi:hypothetical protein